MKNKIFYKVLTVFYLSILVTTSLYAAKPIVSSIASTSATTTSITVSWILPTALDDIHISSLVIYKDTRPIAGHNALNNMTPIATLPNNSVAYTDYVSDYREYYYAVIALTKPGATNFNDNLYYDEELDSKETSEGGKPYLIILPGVNATVTGVRAKSPIKKTTISQDSQSFKEVLYTDGRIREQPLPSLDLLGDATKKSTISKKTKDKVLSNIGIKNSTKKPEILEQYIFEQDMMNSSSGDDYLLYDILKSTFVNKKYLEAMKTLQKFLAQNRTQSVTERANFYLGETFYYQGMYREALGQFILFKDSYPILSQKWIESTLELYEIPISENN